MGKRVRKNNKRKVKKINPIALLIIFIIVIFLTPRFVSTAKYVYNVIHEHYLSSKDFYFSSDKLSINHTEYEITNNWSGAEPYVITINMSSKQNDMSYTESDIEYSITYTCSDNIQCTLNKNTSTIVGTKNHGVNEDYFTISISPNGNSALGEGEKAWIDITATSTSPYSQTLSGKLILEVGSAEITYEIIDAANQPYLTVNITNSQSIGADITLTYNPEIVLLDMTSRFRLSSTDDDTQQLNGHAYLKSITSHVESLSTTTIRFYKNDSTQDYSYSPGSGITPVISLSH
ncbi:MAG: hypothetical protein IJK18_02150 [Clostridia bacterium]|nr:hypothetical protein [Clostridia bacterium]